MPPSWFTVQEGNHASGSNKGYFEEGQPTPRGLSTEPAFAPGPTVSAATGRNIDITGTSKTVAVPTAEIEDAVGREVSRRMAGIEARLNAVLKRLEDTVKVD